MKTNRWYRCATIRSVQISCGPELIYLRDKMTDIVSFNQTNGESSVSVAIGNDSDVPVVVGNDSAAPQPKQHEVMAIVHRNVINVSGPVTLQIESDQMEEPQSQKSGSVHKSIVKVRTINQPGNQRNSAYGWITNGFWTVVAIVMITVGSIYMHKCSGHQLIPIFLVVEGVVILLEVIRQVICRLDGTGGQGDKLGCEVKTVLFIWLIVESVWVYSAPVTHNSNDTTGLYCHRVPFVFAMVQIATFWVLLGLWMVVRCVACRSR